MNEYSMSDRDKHLLNSDKYIKAKDLIRMGYSHERRKIEVSKQKIKSKLNSKYKSLTQLTDDEGACNKNITISKSMPKI